MNKILARFWPYLPFFGVTFFTVIVLYQWGRPWWCELGDLSPWSWDVSSSHNSQHLLDHYTASHFLHGFLFLWIFQLIRVPSKWWYFAALMIESCWELLENSSFIIDRYRTTTIALNYYGDSILNSLSDIAFCLVGVWVAKKLKFFRALLVFIGVELLMVLSIRDCLLLNILMLTYPVEAVKIWQAG